MRATVMYRAGDVRIENVPDATIEKPTDAVIRITRACICGSDLWPYNDMQPTDTGRRMGHEAIGVVEAVGTEVHTIKRGDVVVMPFAYSDGTCMFCDEGLQTSCLHGGFFGAVDGPGGAQAEALRIPQADGTLFVLPVSADDALMPSLLTLTAFSVRQSHLFGNFRFNCRIHSTLAVDHRSMNQPMPPELPTQRKRRYGAWGLSQSEPRYVHYCSESPNNPFARQAVRSRGPAGTDASSSIGLRNKKSWQGMGVPPPGQVPLIGGQDVSRVCRFAASALSCRLGNFRSSVAQQLWRAYATYRQVVCLLAGRCAVVRRRHASGRATALYRGAHFPNQ
jgi:Alcohol dehydrogenase GroES-like domain